MTPIRQVCSHGMATISLYLPTIALLAITATMRLIFGRVYLPSSVSCDAIATTTLFHFTHANIFHIIANFAALSLFKPRWRTLIIAYIAATIAAAVYLPLNSLLHLIDLPTCGMSAIACAAFARPYVSWKRKPYRFILLQLPFALIPNFNFIIHILAFITSYAIWKLIYKKNGR